MQRCNTRLYIQLARHLLARLADPKGGGWGGGAHAFGLAGVAQDAKEGGGLSDEEMEALLGVVEHAAGMLTYAHVCCLRMLTYADMWGAARGGGACGSL